MKDMKISTAMILLALSVPGYIVCKEYVAPCMSSQYHAVRTDLTSRTSNNTISSEEDILEAKVKSESIRSGPAFLNSHAYHNRRTERVKSVYGSICHSVNQNLDQGNKIFQVCVDEDDAVILNVVRRLLIDELDKDGYTAKVSIHRITTIEKTPSEDTSEDEIKQKSYFEITIV